MSENCFLLGRGVWKAGRQMRIVAAVHASDQLLEAVAFFAQVIVFLEN